LRTLGEWRVAQGQQDRAVHKVRPGGRTPPSNIPAVRRSLPSWRVRPSRSPAP